MLAKEQLQRSDTFSDETHANIEHKDNKRSKLEDDKRIFIFAEKRWKTPVRQAVLLLSGSYLHVQGTSPLLHSVEASSLHAGGCVNAMISVCVSGALGGASFVQIR